MIEKEVKTYKVEIIVGLNGSFEEAEIVCETFCNLINVGFEIFQTKLKSPYYGEKPCIHVIMINHPRNPRTDQTIWDEAVSLGVQLARELKQKSFTIVGIDKTRMYEL
jgi:hypothetical protein